MWSAVEGGKKKKFKLRGGHQTVVTKLSRANSIEDLRNAKSEICNTNAIFTIHNASLHLFLDIFAL